MRRIFQFDETSLNSSSSDTYSRTASQSTTTINDYSLKSSSSDPYSRTASQSTNFSSGQRPEYRMLMLVVKRPVLRMLMLVVKRPVLSMLMLVGFLKNQSRSESYR
nr:hypothetical protein 105 - radish mitochondrion [Raphanus sativus]